MILFALLFLLWVLLNGRVTAEICVFGLAVAGALTWFSGRFLGYGEKRRSVKFYLYLAGYLFVLLWEVLKANTQVFRIVLAGRLSFSPALVYFDTDLKDELSQVMLANSITLTPGTITVQNEGGRFCVHALDRSLAEGIENSIFVRMLRRMEEI